ncbi:hypothetical protein KAR91_62245 [Candidatus Pacearchaeota archaeon]|nr:hypothetical protein [Candidatus Pacearchaeota archaeon]
MSIHESILVEAESIVHGDRDHDYGHPLDDFTRTAALWSVILGDKLTSNISVKQVGLMMIAMKISR